MSTAETVASEENPDKIEEIEGDYSPGYKSYVLLMLTGVYTFNFIDRQILVILQESIKEELLLSDTQLGLLTGLAFVFFYVGLGIPIARLADRMNRRNIVAFSLALWSLMTAVCGLATQYIHLFLARVGVGIGEAGGSPPSHSMISDYFPPSKRATALAIYSMGVYLGILVGYTGGGWIDQTYGWRAAFFILGIPGLVYALLLLLTVKEPKRGHSEPNKKISKETIPLGETVRALLAKRTFWLLAVATGVHCYASYGVGNFFPSFLIRVHGMEIAQVGLWMGLAAGVGGMIGTFLGGYFADKLGTRDIRWYLWIVVIAELIVLPPSLVSFFAADLSVVLFAYFLTALFQAIFLGPCLAVTQNLVDIKSRALASAVLFFILNLIGMGLGPLGIGLLSDYFSADFGAESLRYAFCSAFITGGIAAVLFYMASRSYKKDLGMED